MGDALADLATREAVLAAMADGVLLVDGGELVYANAAARRMLDRPVSAAGAPEETSLLEAVHAVCADATVGGDDPVARQLEAGDSVLEVTAHRTGRSGAVLAVVRDVTRARSIDRLRRDFVANASHELKTPVASILALSEVLRTAVRDDPGAVPRFVDRLEGEAERLASLVTDLLELSRLEVGTPTRVEVRLDLVVRAEVERSRPRAVRHGLTLAVDAAEPIVVLGAESDLAHLVNNLLDNAIRYTPPGGAIEAGLRRRPDAVELTVRDTGVGIPDRDLERIFERFYRVDVARSRETGGTGLGLSIVRNIAELHGGTVQVASRLGAGSVFTVCLPLPGRPSLRLVR